MNVPSLRISFTEFTLARVFNSEDILGTISIPFIGYGYLRFLGRTVWWIFRLRLQTRF